MKGKVPAQPLQGGGRNLRGVGVRAEFAKHETLMMLLREDAWAGLTMAVRTMQLGTLAGWCLNANHVSASLLSEQNITIHGTFMQQL